MEWNIILAHELHEFHIWHRFTIHKVLTRHPPSFPFVSTVCSSYRNIPNRSVKPHIKYFISEPIQWNRCSPFQITGDAPRFQSLIKPSFRHMHTIRTPSSLFRRSIYVSLQVFRELWQVQKHMPGALENRFAARHCTFGILQFGRIQQRPTRIALIPSGIFIETLWAGPCHIPICQKLLQWLTVQLLHCLLLQVPILSQLIERFLGYFCLIARRSPTKFVKLNIKPVINLLVNGIVFVT
mmetsp:Transcript_8524/g.17054  ORF Transcript_8524/g.17054 Transcript_8524/m.17054 type:complete len:239 (+) Transcript_8524:2457-3173(+)